MRTVTRVVIGSGQSNVPLCEKEKHKTKRFDSRISCCLRNVWGPGVFHEAHDESKDMCRMSADWWSTILVQIVREAVRPVFLFLPGAFGEQKKEEKGTIYFLISSILLYF